MIAHKTQRTNRNIQHIVYNINGGWSVVRDGASRASRNFKKKEDAISCGRTIAKRHSAELVIHNQDGSIHEVNTYAVSPCAKGNGKH